jgi:hypothetical protein
MATKRLPRPRDPLQLGKLIVDIATGQVEDKAEDGKDWEIADIATLIDAREGPPKKRGPYRKRAA